LEEIVLAVGIGLTGTVGLSVPAGEGVTIGRVEGLEGDGLWDAVRLGGHRATAAVRVECDGVGRGGRTDKGTGTAGVRVVVTESRREDVLVQRGRSRAADPYVVEQKGPRSPVAERPFALAQTTKDVGVFAIVGFCENAQVGWFESSRTTWPLLFRQTMTS